MGRSASSGFSRIEAVVLMFVLLLAGTSVWLSFEGWLENSRINRAVENARTISTLLGQYAVDSGGTYPVGEGTAAAGKSEGIAQVLLANNYTPDPRIFALGATAPYTGTAHDFADFSPANIAWDFTAGATATTGLGSDAPDLLPVVFSTGETIPYPTTPGAGLDLVPSGRGPFGTVGVVVADKDTSARFVPSTIPGALCRDFISKDFQGTGPYTQLRP